MNRREFDIFKRQTVSFGLNEAELSFDQTCRDAALPDISGVLHEEAVDQHRPGEGFLR